MMDSIEAIETYTVSSFDTFQQDEKTQDAIMFNLVILGEAANKIPDDFQEAHPEFPWSSMVGTRNLIVHGYDQVKIRIVWDIIQNNIPQLRETLKTVI